MIAQDTGSAIVGPARADLYLGAGDDASRIAGRIRHPGRFVMLLPRELDMIAAGKHMPLPVPKPKLAEVVEVNKQEQDKVDSADENWRRQVWTRKPAPRDCAIASGVDCGRKSVPPVTVMSKHPSTTDRRSAGSNQEQQRQQQQGPQPGIQGRGPYQLQQAATRQKQQLKATAGREPQQRQQQAAIERRGPQEKQQLPATEGRGSQYKQPPHAMERRGEPASLN